MSNIFDSSMHIDSALHQIEEARYLLNDEINSFSRTTEAQALIDAETALCLAMEKLNERQAKSITAKIDLSALILKAKNEISEKEAVLKKNNQYRLERQKLTELYCEEVKKMFESNGFSEVRVSYEVHETTYDEHTRISVYKPDSSERRGVCVIVNKRLPHHKISTGEVVPVLNAPFLCADDGYYVTPYASLTDIVASRPNEMVSLLRFMLS